MSIEEYQDFTTVYANGFYNGEEKWKNKIRAKIKEYEEINMDVFTFEIAEDLKKILEEN